MTVAVLSVALLSGLFTVVFLLDGVRRVYAGTLPARARVLLITMLLSVLTGIFTIWQLVLVFQQFSFH